MASPSGATSGSSTLLHQSSGSEKELQLLMEQRKTKRMISNRESARRSRMKKQIQLDDLTVQVARLRNENHRIIFSLSVTTQNYLNFESENLILRAQVAELSQRLESLNEIISLLNTTNDWFGPEEEVYYPAVDESR